MWIKPIIYYSAFIVAAIAAAVLNEAFQTIFDISEVVIRDDALTAALLLGAGCLATA